MKAGKVWGFTEALFDKNNVEINKIKINAGGYCSKHLHLHKHNIFYILQGELEIEVWKKDYELLDITHLRAGQSTDVSPGEYHRFKAKLDCIALEIYYTELSSEDIERDICGGKNF